MAYEASDSLLSNAKESKKFQEGIYQGMRGQLNAPTAFAAKVIKGAEAENGQYKFLRLHQRDGRPYALFRLSGDDGINYHDYQLGESGGKVVATDIYIYLAGEHMTQTLRRAIVPAAKQISKNWVMKLGSSDKAFLENYSKLKEMAQLINQGRGRAALRVYEKLPRDLREMKVVMIQRYMAAVTIDEQSLLDAVDDFKKTHPNDPSLALLSVDAFILRKKYDRALQAVDTLDQQVGGDSYLNTLRASIELERGDQEAAFKHSLALVQSEPDNIEWHWVYVGFLLQGDDHDATYQALEDIDERFAMEWNDLSDNTQYAGFVASPQGQRWRREKGFLDDSPGEGPTTDTPPADKDFDADGEPRIESGRAGFQGSGAPADALRRQYLEWSDKTGKFNVEAKLLGLQGDSVELEKTDGKIITVPLDRLSAKSQAMAKSLAKMADEI